jgi:Nickel responsive protein SCO4226-like
MDASSYFALELGRPAEGWERLDELILSARRAGDELTRAGRHVQFVRSIFVPEDDTCFCVYQAAALEDVREAARRAALSGQRVTEVVSKGGT